MKSQNSTQLIDFLQLQMQKLEAELAQEKGLRMAAEARERELLRRAAGLDRRPVEEKTAAESAELGAERMDRVRKDLPQLGKGKLWTMQESVELGMERQRNRRDRLVQSIQAGLQQQVEEAARDALERARRQTLVQAEDQKTDDHRIEEEVVA